MSTVNTQVHSDGQLQTVPSCTASTAYPRSADHASFDIQALTLKVSIMLPLISNVLPSKVPIMHFLTSNVLPSKCRSCSFWHLTSYPQTVNHALVHIQRPFLKVSIMLPSTSNFSTAVLSSHFVHSACCSFTPNHPSHSL